MDGRNDVTDVLISKSIVCLFQSLSTRSGLLARHDLDRTLAILDKARSVGSQATQSALYDRAKLFIDQLPAISTSNESGGRRENNESFSCSLLGMLGGTWRLGIEAHRRKLALVVRAYAASPAAVAPGNATGNQRLAKTLTEWLNEERSGPVRADVQQALLSLDDPRRVARP